MKKLLIIIVVLALLVGGFFLFMGNVTENVVNNQVKEFTLDASRFKYSPEVIEVNKGDEVKIIVNNIDTIHGIRIPDFNVKGENGVEFTADKAGEFEFYCTVFCGDQHREMKGKIIVK